MNYYDPIAGKYKDTTNQDERLALRILGQERDRIEKQLYTNFFIRLMRKFLVPVRQQQVMNQETKKAFGNEQELKEILIKSCFGNLSNKLEQHIKQGQRKFAIPLSYYLNEKEKVEYNLSFVRDQNGLYQFEAFKAEVKSDDKAEQSRQQTFRMEQGFMISADQAYNLLSGRAIQKEYISIEGQRRQAWVQLDFNDKDASGNLCIKEFHSGYAFNLKQVLDQLPLKEISIHAKEKLMNNLFNGSREKVSFYKDGNEQTFYIEANPRHKSVNIYNENSKKISVASALGNKAANVVQLVKKAGLMKEVSINIKKGMSVS